jgi:S1-C subfamily serine protease
MSMKHIAVLCLLAGLALSARAQNDKPVILTSNVSGTVVDAEMQYVNDTFYPATALLYAQDENGGMNMRCTATAIEKDGDTYTFVTAAHCGAEDDTDEKTVSPEKTFFYITPDQADDKTFLKADPIGAGYRHRGDDFMLFKVTTSRPFPVVKLGTDPKVMEQIVNIASPIGLGKQVFVGIVSNASFDRALASEDINWTHAVGLQLFGTDGGSSGSAVVCMDQKAICAFVVGSVSGTTIVAMPVSRLEAVMAGLKDGSYKYWKKDPDSRPVPVKADKAPTLVPPLQ